MPLDPLPDRSSSEQICAVPEDNVGMGALPALGSYNKFHHDCFKDAIITCIVNTLLAGVLVFSILGYMAHIQETTIHEVVNSGPGLVFLTYPTPKSSAISSETMGPGPAHLSVSLTT